MQEAVPFDGLAKFFERWHDHRETFVRVRSEVEEFRVHVGNPGAHTAKVLDQVSRVCFFRRGHMITMGRNAQRLQSASNGILLALLCPIHNNDLFPGTCITLQVFVGIRTLQSLSILFATADPRTCVPV